MTIQAKFKCDYLGCDAESELVDTSEIDTYDYHDAPKSARMMDEPTGWYWNSWDGWVACPQHKADMLLEPKSIGWANKT